MRAPRLRMFLRAGAVLLFTVLMALMAGSFFRGGPAPAFAARSWQEDYPAETAQSPTTGSDSGYPSDGTTASPTTFVFPTSGGPTLPLPGSTTPTVADTLSPNAFLTENAEQGEGLLTPEGTESPGPTLTPYNTATLTGVTPQPTRTPQVEESSGPAVDWGLFWIGFSLPVLSACGYVLYLLDRRPDLFRRR